MVRRLALLAAAALSLAAAGGASATLLSGRRAGDETTTAATAPAATTTTATAPTTSSVPATTTTTTSGGSTTTTTTPSPPTAAPGKPSTTFLFTGHGWGHGVGMSQWGARGYAVHGWTFDRILAHYYPGTQLGPAPVRQVRVLLADGAKRLVLSSPGAWAVVDGAGAAHDLAPGPLTLRPGLQVRLAASADAQALQPPLSFVPRSGPLQLGGRPYRGSLRVTKTPDGKLQAVDVVGLEDYVKGVVPAEMPSSWPAEALKAQAVAARSYALAQRAPAKPYDLYSDTRSQVYLGVSTETAATNAAVAATAGQVLLYGGRVADALFSSSSGGRTAAAGDVFPSASPVPYLVSVPDPYDASPYVSWTVAVDGRAAAKALGLAAPLLDLQTTAAPSGRVRTAVVTAPTGQVVTSGSDLRDKLGLRSTWFSVGLLSLQPPTAPVAYGSSATLTGVVRGVDAPLLEQRSGSVFWTPVTTFAPAGDGTFAVVVRPLQTTDYRLGAGGVRAAAVRVPVAPVVRLLPSLRGTVRPAAPGTTVDLQAQQGTVWTTVATLPVDATGGFAAGALPPGTYRARYAPGAGLVAGVSAPVQSAP